MVVLGLLLLAASVGAAVSIAASNTDSMSFVVFGWTVTKLSAGGLMLLGIALGVVVLIGFWMLNAGLRRGRRRRQESKNAVQHERSRVDELEEENNRLREVAGRRTSGHAPVPPLRDSQPDANTDANTDTETDNKTDTGERSHTAAGLDTPAYADTTREQDKRVYGRGNT